MATWNKKRPAATPAAPTAEHAKPPAVTPEPAGEAQASVTTAEDRALKMQHQLADAKRLRDVLLRELHQGLDKEEQLASVDAEIAELTRKLNWYAEARAKAAADGTAEAKAARWKQTRDGLQVALDDARALGKRAEKVIATMAALGDELADIEQVKARISLRVSDAIRQQPSGPGIERRVSLAYDKLRQVLSEITLAEHLLKAMHTAGIGTRGIVLPAQFYQLTPFIGTASEWGKEPTEKVVTKAADALKKLCNETLLKLPGLPVPEPKADKAA